MSIEKDFDTLLKYGKRETKYKDRDIDVNRLSYSFVKKGFAEMIEDNKIRQPIIVALKQCFPNERISKLTDSYVLGLFAFLYDELFTEEGTIYKQEKLLLSSKPDPKMIAAGQGLLDPFSYEHTLYHLADKRILDMKAIGEMPYGDILDLQVMKNREAQIQENYMKSLTKK